jgi:hypothetical protein
MLHAVSWIHFLRCILVLTLLYYGGISLLFFRKSLNDFIRKRNKTLLLGPALLAYKAGSAQDGNQGISQANTLIRGYFDNGTLLMYAVSALIALVGAVHVFGKWNHGHQDEAKKAAAAWLGGCVFLVIVATVIRSFFGL